MFVDITRCFKKIALNYTSFREVYFYYDRLKYTSLKLEKYIFITIDYCIRKKWERAIDKKLSKNVT